jgi:pimeloyl-ACP methyl ester carboxylesterase
VNGTPGGPPLGSPVIVLLHGFTRGPEHLAALAAACTQRGWSCVRPPLAPVWAPVLMNSRRHLDRVGARLAPRLTGRPVVVVGHSAGAAAGSWLATRWVGQGVDVRGIVMVDGNDSPNGLIQASWPSLDGIGVRGVLAPPSPCNREGRLERFLEERRPGCTVVIPGSGHGDIEQVASAVYRWACRDASTDDVRRTVLVAALDAVDDLLTEVDAN